MAQRKRGQTTRIPDPVMPKFLSSNAPEILKGEITEILRQLRGISLDGTVIAINKPDLWQRILRTSPVGLDLFRILLGKPPESRSHTRECVAANLRAWRKTHGRSPRTEDIPVGHPNRILALLYYGGVEQWAKGAAARAQLPKNHWANRDNQLAAIREVARRFPGLAITHALLHKAGLHTVARRIDAAGLSALVTESGLERRLRKAPATEWTAERTLAAYVALCRERNTTLSTAALAAIGGVASSLRARGRHFFGSHASFVEAAIKFDSAIKPLNQPTTRDGRRLGSWAEVAVYEAMRRHLPPETDIHNHQRLLPELPRHSCDAVVGHTVWVEVLMVAPSEMYQAAANATVQRYAQRWEVKTAWYASKGVPLVLIEPSDISNPDCLKAKVDLIGHLLNRPGNGGLLSPAPVELTPPRGFARPRRFWTVETLCKAVREVAGASAVMPTAAMLAAAGHGGAVAAMKREKLRDKVAAACGLTVQHHRGIWTREAVIDGLVAWATREGQYPSTKVLKTGGAGRLASALSRLFPGETASVRKMVELRCGLAAGGRAPSGSYNSQAKIAETLRPLCDRLGRFPTAAEIADERLPSTLYSMISRQFGVARMAGFMGIAYHGPERLAREQALALLMTAASRPPLLPPDEPPTITTVSITARLGSRGIKVLHRHFGSIKALRKAIEEHARINRAKP